MTSWLDITRLRNSLSNAPDIIATTGCTDECPLSGVKRTCLAGIVMSAYDPKRTSRRGARCENPAPQAAQTQFDPRQCDNADRRWIILSSSDSKSPIAPATRKFSHEGDYALTVLPFSSLDCSY